MNDDAATRVMEILEKARTPLTIAQLRRRTGLSHAATYLAIVELRGKGKVQDSVRDGNEEESRG